MTKFSSLARARVIGPEGGTWSGGTGEGAASVDVLVVSSSLTSCFGVLHSVCVHLESFRNFKKHGAKRREMVQLM